jgi:hypothetical protein
MTASSKPRWFPSGKQNPCPICGREKDGDCRTSGDGLEVLCHYGKTHRPPEGLKPGDPIQGADGQTWGFTKDSKDGRAAHFTIDKPLPGRKNRAKVIPFPARPAAPQPAPPPPPAAMPAEPPTLALIAMPTQASGSPYYYDLSHRVNRAPLPDGGKGFYCEHEVGGRWVDGAGPDPWPLFGCTAFDQGLWALELEGEKCAELVEAAGWVGISQPGHAHSVAQIRQRYEALVGNGAAGVVYLADNDAEGKRRAQQSIEAAALAGLPLIVLHAGDLWPDLPVGGSIDDAPGTVTEQIAAIEAAARLAHAAAPWTSKEDDDGEHQGENAPPEAQPTNKVMQLAEVRERLTAAVADGASQSDLEVLRLRLAGASDQNPAALVNLLRAIEQEHEARSAIAAEARTLRAEQDRHEIGQAITLDYLFPPSLAEALQTRCRYLPADAPSTALSLLAAVAGLVKLGSEVIGIRAADFRVPLNLFTALVGKSGAKKSPLRKLVVDQPAEPLRLDLARAHTRALEQWRQDNQGVSKSDRTEPPEAVYISVSNTTVEALAQQLQRQEGKGLGLLINRDELSGLFGSLGAYKSGRGDDEQHLLEAYDGGAFRCLRISSPEGGRSYDRCSLSIYGTIQPGVLEKLVASGDDSGLWARFLFVPLPEKVVPLPEIETELEIEKATAAADALAQACSAVYRMPRISLELSPEARRAFVRYEGNAQQEAIRASIGAQSALWGKAAGKVLRIAGLLHLLQLAAPDGQASELITADTMERATALVNHINGWTLSLHADLARSGANDLMRMVHRIAMEAQQPIKWKEIAPRLSGKQRKEIDSKAVAMAMEALVELGVGEIEQGSRGAVIYRATAALP